MEGVILGQYDEERIEGKYEGLDVGTSDEEALGEDDGSKLNPMDG